MANANNQSEILYQNLTDAGCSEELIKKCMELFRQNETAQMIKLLRAYKESMLALLHKSEESIDCLDFLIYRLKKENQ